MITKKESHQKRVQDCSERAWRESMIQSRSSVVAAGRLGLVLLRGSLLGLGLAGRVTLGTLVLHILIIDAQGLVNLGAESLIIVEPVMGRKVLANSFSKVDKSA